MRARTFLLPSPEDTRDLGRRLAACLSPGDVVVLSGPVGAGKSTLVGGLLEVWTGTRGPFPSPTFTLVHSYLGPRGQLHHVDLYRLQRVEEVLELDLDEVLSEAAIAVIEWGERAAPLLPPTRWQVDLAPSADGGRVARVGFFGDDAGSRLACLGGKEGAP